MRTLRFLLRKEYLQIFRDRVIVRMLFLMPVLQLLLLSNAATFEVRSARLYVVDQDRTPASRSVVERLAGSGRFVPVAASPSVARADDALLSADADAILVVPRDFERDLVRGRRAQVQLVLDAENGVAAGVMQSYAAQILAAYSAELGAEVAPTLATIDARDELPPWRGRPVIEVRRRGWYNPDLRYLDYMVPGIVVVLVTVTGTLLTAMNIVREKEAGTLDQLNVTPLARPTFIAAKLIPLWSIALFDLALGLAVGHFLFGVPVRGSLALVFLAAVIYLPGALGIGLWISTIVETQQQAMFVTFFILMIYLLMSGLLTPIDSMPHWVQLMSELNPVRHFVTIARAILMKGAGLTEIMRPLVILAVYSVVVLALSIRQYSKRTA